MRDNGSLFQMRHRNRRNPNHQIARALANAQAGDLAALKWLEICAPDQLGEIKMAEPFRIPDLIPVVTHLPDIQELPDDKTLAKLIEAEPDLRQIAYRHNYDYVTLVRRVMRSAALRELDYKL